MSELKGQNQYLLEGSFVNSLFFLHWQLTINVRIMDYWNHYSAKIVLDGLHGTLWPSNYSVLEWFLSTLYMWPGTTVFCTITTLYPPEQKQLLAKNLLFPTELCLLVFETVIFGIYQNPCRDHSSHTARKCNRILMKGSTFTAIAQKSVSDFVGQL